MKKKYCYFFSLPCLYYFKELSDIKGNLLQLPFVHALPCLAKPCLAKPCLYYFKELSDIKSDIAITLCPRLASPCQALNYSISHLSMTNLP